MTIDEEYKNESLNKEIDQNNTKNKNTIEVLKKLNENSYKDKIRQYLIEYGTLKLYCDNINVIDNVSELNNENKSQLDQKNYIARGFNELIKDYEKEGVTVDIKNNDYTTIIGFYVNSKYNSHISNNEFDTLVDIRTKTHDELIKNNYWDIYEFPPLTPKDGLNCVLWFVGIFVTYIIVAMILPQDISYKMSLGIVIMLCIIFGILLGMAMLGYLFSVINGDN